MYASIFLRVGQTAGQELKRKSESSYFKDLLCNHGLSLCEHQSTDLFPQAKGRTF